MGGGERGWVEVSVGGWGGGERGWVDVGVSVGGCHCQVWEGGCM